MSQKVKNELHFSQHPFAPILESLASEAQSLADRNVNDGGVWSINPGTTSVAAGVPVTKDMAASWLLVVMCCVDFSADYRTSRGSAV